MRSSSFPILALAIAAQAGASAADTVSAPTTTVLTVIATPASVQPGSYTHLTYRFEATGPLAENDKLVVRIIDDAGKVVAQGDHAPQTWTNFPEWNGKISYRRPLDIPANAPEGSYRIVVGLAGKKNETLIPGAGVIELPNHLYNVGILTIDKNAPHTKADTEGKKTLNLDDYQLTFAEEFDGPLDASSWGPGTRWITHTPWKGDFGDAIFSEPDEGFFTIQNGVLRIEARKDEAFAAKDQWQRKWKAGLLATCDEKGNGFAQQYGYFEWRVKFPEEIGVWPALWLFSACPNWMTPGFQGDCIEIDVLEAYGWPEMYCSVVHVWKPDPHRAIDTHITVRPHELSSDFHNYGCLVDPANITMYIDGVEVWKTRTPPQHTKPLMFLLNFALGSGWPIDKVTSPSYMYVDYVRAYAKK